MYFMNRFFFLLTAIFFISLGFSFYADLSPHVDAKAYNHIGWNLARGVGYIENEELADRREDDAIFRVGPGYEFFLAGIYSFAGMFLEKGEIWAPYAQRPYALKWPWQFVWVVHAFSRVITAWLLFKIALLLFNRHPQKERIGYIAAAIFGFFPDLILINGFLLYETLLLFLGVTAVYFSLRTLMHFDIFSQTTESRSSPAALSRYIDMSKYRDVLLASLFWALAILTRPSELLPFLVFPLALIFARNGEQMTKKMRYVFLSFVFPILLVGGWSLRNTLYYDQPLFTTTAGAYALWVGNNEHATGGYDRPTELKEARAYHSTVLSSLAIERVKTFIKERPLKFVGLQLRKTVTYFSLIRPTGFWPEFENKPRERLLLIISSAIATAFLFIGGTAGAWLLWKQRDNLTVALLGFAAAKPLAIIPFYVETRYRYGLYPLLALTAAFFIITILSTPSSRRAALINAARVTALFLVITSIDVWFSLPVIIYKLSLLL